MTVDFKPHGFVVRSAGIVKELYKHLRASFYRLVHRLVLPFKRGEKDSKFKI